MYNQENSKTNKPFIYIKKLNKKSKIIPLGTPNNLLGMTRYSSPSSQEWNDSIYGYNNITIKNITIAKKTLTKLIKSYFNMYFIKNFLQTKIISTKLKRLAVNRIFTSKAQLKHTHSKVIITLYVYNEQRRILVNKLKKLEIILFPSDDSSSKRLGIHSVSLFSLNKKFSLIKKVDSDSFLNTLEKIKSYITKELTKKKKF